MTTDNGFFFGRYYKIPTADNGKLNGVIPYHAYFCGQINEKDDLWFIHWYTGDKPDTFGRYVEAYDYAPMTDPVMTLPFFAKAMADETLEYPAEDMLSNLCASTAQALWYYLNNGYTFSEAVEELAGILDPACVGETFEEVCYGHPDWLVETVTTDAKGNEVKTYNIHEVKFR